MARAKNITRADPRFFAEVLPGPATASRRLWATLAIAVVAIAACASSSTPRSAPIEQPGLKGVTLTYLGTAGWKIEAGSSLLLIDPYFSRLSVENDDQPLVPDEAQIARYSPTLADAILVSHSHYDHVLDVASIAKRTGAVVIGSTSTSNVESAAGVAAEKLLLARGGETFHVGLFDIRTMRGLHSLTGDADEEVPKGATLPMSARNYRAGETLDFVIRAQGRTILFIGSANYIESELAGLHPDVAIVATRLREKIPDYTCRLMRALALPPLFFANHFDAHWERLGPNQMKIDPGDEADLRKVETEVHTCAPSTKVMIPIHLEPIAI